MRQILWDGRKWKNGTIFVGVSDKNGHFRDDTNLYIQLIKNIDKKFSGVLLMDNRVHLIR